ncbi:MAG: hypothetical protein ACP5NQ_08665 [Vulcanisaeta sp.]
MVKWVLFVEDSYGVYFHSELMSKLRALNIINVNPKIKRLPTGKCNNALRKKVLAVTVSEDQFKIVFVIDEEGKGVDNAVNDVLTHMRGVEDRVKVVVVRPMHETWLCIGLGYDKVKCRKSPIDELRRNRRDYKKEYLAEWARYVDVKYLVNEDDFKDYLNALNWLSVDP